MERVSLEGEAIVSRWSVPKPKHFIRNSLKAFFYSLVIMLDVMLESLAMMCVGSLLLMFGFCVFITTPFWAMWFFFTWIPTVLTILVLMYSKIGAQVSLMAKKCINWLLYESTKPRRCVWSLYFEFMAWLYPDDSFYIMNSGYALLSEDGLMNKFSPLDHESKEIYQYQLYHTVVNMAGKNIITNKKIVDLSCGRGGGTFFLYSLFRPKKIYGVDLAIGNISACRETFVKEEQKSLLRKRKKLRTIIAKKLSLSEAELKSMQQHNRDRIHSASVFMPVSYDDSYFDENHQDSNTPIVSEKSHENSSVGHSIRRQESGQEFKGFLSKREDDWIEESSEESMLQRLEDLCQLEYIAGDAETLHELFPKDCIDCVLSIESSNCYGNLEEFFRSTYLMLKKAKHTIEEQEDAGTFLYADYFDVEQLENVKKLFSKYFITLKSENITANVFHAMKLDGKQRRNRIINSVNWVFRPFCRKNQFRILHPAFGTFSDLYQELKDKKKVYYSFVLQKRGKVQSDLN